MYRYITDSVYMQTHISTDYLYTHRIFFITNDVALNIYYIDIHHQLKEIFNDLNISLMIFQSVEL